MTVRELITQLEWFANDNGDDTMIVSPNDWPICSVEVITSEIDGKVYGIITEG